MSEESASCLSCANFYHILLDLQLAAWQPPLGPAFLGFVADRQAGDLVFAMDQLIEQSSAWREDWTIVQADVYKCFDCQKWNPTLDAMLEQGTPVPLAYAFPWPH